MRWHPASCELHHSNYGSTPVRLPGLGLAWALSAGIARMLCVEGVQSVGQLRGPPRPSLAFGGLRWPPRCAAARRPQINLTSLFCSSYETGNGIQAQEQGQLKNVGTPDEAMAVVGSFSYTGPDAVQYSVQYTADDNGFNAQGSHLPTPPPIPAELAKALEAAARLPDPNDGGQYQPKLYVAGPGR